MHELSIALSIIEGAEEQLTALGAERAQAVYLRLGPLSGVVKEALLFSFDLACEGTRLEGSRLEIEEIPIVLLCRSCGGERAAVSLQDLRCIDCGAPGAEMIRGAELEVFALELADEHATAAG